MDIFFQLLDVTTGNLVTEFDSEEAAIEALREAQAEDGDGPLLDLALLRFQDGHPILIAKERDLVLYVARAMRRESDRVTTSQQRLQRAG